MMNMEWSILPGYAREEEIRQLFTEYTNMVLAGDPTFAGYLARQHYEEELAHPARQYAPPPGRRFRVCSGRPPVGGAARKALAVRCGRVALRLSADAPRLPTCLRASSMIFLFQARIPILGSCRSIASSKLSARMRNASPRTAFCSSIRTT